MPIRIEDHIYYRRLSNMADAMTLYRFPITELAKWHEYGKTDEIHEIETPLQVNSLMSEVPPYPHDPELNDNLNFK